MIVPCVRHMRRSYRTKKTDRPSLTGIDRSSPSRLVRTYTIIGAARLLFVEKNVRPAGTPRCHYRLRVILSAPQRVTATHKIRRNGGAYTIEIVYVGPTS